MPTATKKRPAPVDHSVDAILDNERSIQCNLAVGYEALLDQLDERHDDIRPATIYIKPQEWALIHAAGPRDGSGQATVVNTHDLVRLIESRRSIRKMLDELDGWPGPIEAARVKLREAEHVLATTRATLEDLAAEGVDEPALESQLRVLTNRLAKLRAERAAAASEVTRLQSLHDALVLRAPRILQQTVERRRHDLFVDQAERNVEGAEYDIEQWTKWLGDGQFSLRKWNNSRSDGGGYYRIGWQAVENLCPDAIDRGTDGKSEPQLKMAIWTKFLDHQANELPAKVERLAELRAEAERLSDQALAPIHQWLNRKRLELDMVESQD
jgi:hypothetical protein